jgi:Glycosyl hydrolase family 99
VGRLLLAALLLTVAVSSTVSMAQSSAEAIPVRAASAHSTPVFAYYYIWFDPSSWNRAKTDLPTLGKYSSDDPNVMRQHIVWAKSAGIDGFIVSWKHTPTLDRRLAQLVDIAESEHFSLEVIYEGLDFNKSPQPVERVAADFQYFATTFAPRAPFRTFSKPLLIWSGTWMYSVADVAQVTQLVRPGIMVLASEKSVAGYDRLADSVDGDAYYWSSVNPDTNTGYLEKLVDLSNAIHNHDGLWIAPAAAGFDARQIGGKTIVDRQDGEVLQHELATANASAPDALGVISWNEFSENSHIEPSKKYGSRYLQVLAYSLGHLASLPTDANGSDSTDSSSPGSGFPTGLIVLPVVAIFSLATAIVVYRRSSRIRRSDTKRSRSATREQKHIAKMRRRRRRVGDVARDA